MAYTVTQVESLVRATGIDAEGTNFYDLDLHLIPAMNQAIRWLVRVCAIGIEQKRFSEEHLSEMIYTYVYQTNALSRISIDSDIFTILGVFPLPVCLPDSNPVLSGNEYDSKNLSSSHQFVSADKTAWRLTTEEYYQNQYNPYKPGNSIQSLAEAEHSFYGYISHGTYGIYSGGQSGRYIEVIPALDRKLCAIKFIETPALFSAGTDSIPIGDSLLNAMVMKTVEYVTLKQGDGYTIHQETKDEVSQLILMMK